MKKQIDTTEELEKIVLSASKLLLEDQKDLRNRAYTLGVETLGFVADQVKAEILDRSKNR